MEEMRRQAIVFKFRLMGEPAQEHWQGPGGTLARIRQWLDMPYTADVRPIAKVLNRYLEGDSLTAYGNCGGRNRKLTHGEALVAADCLARNMGREQAAYVVSARRQEKGIYGDKADVSSFAIRTGFRALDGVTHRRGTTSTGSRDVDSPWATSRLAQVLQFKAELMLPDEEAQAEADARAEGESFKLEGTRARVRSLADDPLHIIGKGEVVRPRGSWWPNQPAAVRKKTWPCELVGYVSEFTFSNGDKEEMYILSCQGFYYPMRASDVRHLLPQRLLPTGVETSTGRTFRSRRSPGATRSTRSAASAATRASTSTASRSRLAARTTGRSPRAASTRSASHGRRPSTRATAAASSMA